VNTLKIKTQIYLLIGVILVLLITATMFSYFTVNRLKSNLDIQVHTTTVMLALDSNLIFLLNAETGERGFVITGDTNYLEPYNQALRNIAVTRARLRALTKDNPRQQRTLDTLEILTDKKIVRMVSVITLKKQDNDKAIKSILATTNEGKDIMDRIRAVNQTMKVEELKLREARTANTKKSIETARIILFFEDIFSLLITLFLAFIILRALDRRTKTEKELTISNERFYKIFEENPIAMSLSEIGTSKIVFANNLFYKYFGYSKEEIIGHSSQDLKLISPEEEARLFPIILAYLKETRSIAELQALPPEENEKLVTKLKQAMGDMGIEVLYNRKNGETFYAIVSYDQIEIENKKYTITSYQDISAQKKAEDKIIAYSVELEKKNKEIEQFAYISSHDLQEPLRTIANFSKLLAQRLELHPDPESTEYMGYISRGAERMSQLIFDLLEYSRIGKDMSKSAIDCDQLLNEVLTDMSASIIESGAEIHKEHLPVIKGYNYLKSLFQNLISNAIKFRKAGTHPVISIGVKDRGKEFLFSVKDNGMGIEKIYFDKIFSIFQRLHSRELYKGTGIGLALCKKIAEHHGGKIWVESEPEKGSVFYFTIPKI
jgi:signal transduction histidine kinase/CHASE3 domain sensor protein